MIIKSHKFYVYFHSAGNDIFFIGCGKAHSVNAFKNRSERWRRAAANRTVEATIVSEHSTKREALREAARHIEGLRPAGNLIWDERFPTAQYRAGFIDARPRTPLQKLASTDRKVVIVSSTGRRFSTVPEAARYYGLSGPTVWNALRSGHEVQKRRIGFKAIADR